MKTRIQRTVLSMLTTITAFTTAFGADPVPAVPLPGGPSAWRLVWQEEFDKGEADLDARWAAQNGPSTHILCSRWRENAVAGNGTLRLVNRKESRGGQQWTSGSVWTKERFTYGYFEARYRYAAASGTNNSFWLMTNTPGEPEKGKRFEIDINEGHYPNEINTNIHNHSDVTTNSDGKKTHPVAPKTLLIDQEGKPADLAAEFHVYGLLWTPDELVFYFDGREIRREKNDFAHSPSPVWLSLAIVPWAGKVTDAINGTFMEIDYVRVFERGDPSASSTSRTPEPSTTNL
jgi:beta-glucanase (GH16 family)